MPPSTLSTRPYYMHAPVTLAGFSLGEHKLPAHRVFYDQPQPADGTILRATFALHAHFTSIVSSMPLPQNASSAGGNDAEAVGAPGLGGGDAHVGYVGYKPEQGLSGGAVLDADCRLVGIIELRSFWAPSGRFVRLTASVLERLLGAVCWGTGAEAC
jgi:hypothetical protein